MFRFAFAMATCLMLSLPSHAFFNELYQAVESMFQEHEGDVKTGKKTAKELANELDRKLVKVKELSKKLAEKILHSSFVTEKMRRSLVDALTLFEGEVEQKVENAKKMLQEASTSDL